MNYSDLSTAIQRYTQNDEATFVAEIPNFIKKAEKRIYDDTQLLVARKNSTSTTTASQQYVQTPDDFLAPYSMAVTVAGSYTTLIFVDETFIREVYPAPTTTGLPQHYSMFDHDTMLLGPTPDQTYTVELHYFYYPTSIVDSSTSWLGTNAEGALLYGSLLEAYRFMKGDADVMASYQMTYDKATDALKLLSAGRDRGDAYRFGQFATKVMA